MAVLGQGARPSGADFTAGSAHAKTTFGTATLFNSVAVSVTNPGTPLRGTVAVNATATSDEAMASVRIQRSPAGAGTWTDLCTDTVAAYSCSWTTTGVTDGLYDLRAIAVDALGYTQTSAIVANRRVDNTAPATTMTDPGTPLTGTKALAATGTDAGSGVADVELEYRTSPSGTWTTICTDTTSAYGCSWNTTAVADGLYDLRSTATDNAGNTATSIVSSRRVDNTAPAVTVVEDGTPRRGNATITAAVDDGNGSGVLSVLMEIRLVGSATWMTACVDNTAVYSCSGDTTGIPDGMYDLRATATDRAGFVSVSAIVQTRLDNTAPSAATIANPGSPLFGTRTLTGSGADAGSGVAALRFEYRLNGSTGAWATACTDTVTPFTTCNWNTTAVANGSYDLRSVAVDGAGNERASTAVTARVVDNTSPTATDVQATNGGTSGRIDTGDVITFTHSQTMLRSSIRTGWTTGTLAVTVRVIDNGAQDYLDFYDSTNTTRLGLTASASGLQLMANHVGAAGARFAATMTQSTNRLIVTLGAPTGTVNTGVVTTTPMVWTPSTAATNATGVACLSPAATESGTADADF